MTNPTERQLVDDLCGLAPLLAEHALEAERDRKPVDQVMKAIEDTGAYRYFVPQRFGGFEYSVEGFMEIGLALGAGCLSTAWVTTFCMEHNWLLGLFPQEAQEDIFGKHPYVIAPGALAPKGQATPVEGGYQLSGQWQWGTGIMHADWVLLGALTPKRDEDGMALCMYALPVGDAEVLDTWYIDGMVGTGSNDIAVKDVFVPAHRVVDLGLCRDGSSPGAQWHRRSLYRMPMMPFLGLTAAAPAVGAAIGAVGHFRDWLEGRTMYGTTTKQRDKPLAQSRLALAQVEAESVRNQLMTLARETSDWGAADAGCPEMERARLRLHIAHCVRRARDLVRNVVEACGASAHFLDNPLQRAQRDLNTLSCHTVFDLDVGSELYGRLMLGLEPNSPV